MADFLADNNRCGQAALKIVAKGNAILAEIFRLKDWIPQIFRLDSKLDMTKYGDIITDFSYFPIAEQFEKNIEKNPKLQELDEEVRDNYLELLTKFYQLFESIHNYIINLNRFLLDVQSGLYIQMNFETLLGNVEGRQIMAESVYLYGVMLLLVDYHFDGSVRERLLTSFYRYAAGYQSSETNVDDVCKLFRMTKLKKSATNYPQDYFARIPIEPTFLKLLIGSLRSDDLYNQLRYYPLPEHRSNALSSQASLLAITLYFTPTILHNEFALMREIVDKFFPDNWIIPIYMDFHINLIQGWEGFKAGSQALSNTIEIGHVKKMISSNLAQISPLIRETQGLLKESTLTPENILERASPIINLLRNSNVLLRWFILHSSTPPRPSEFNKKAQQLRNLILNEPGFSQMDLLSLLLLTSQLEMQVKDLIRSLLDQKAQNWNSYKVEAVERVKELSGVFNGDKPLNRLERNERLSNWLTKKADQINELNFGDLLDSGRKIIELIRSFHGMLEYHELEDQTNVVEWVVGINAYLERMLRTGSINEDLLVSISIVGDFGYAWGSILESYTPLMQNLIRSDPGSIIKLRSVFLKLSSVLEVPLMRLGQAKSPELLSVSAYYSGELLNYVQRVLQIIPESVFSLLHEIIALQTHSIRELPTRLEKDRVKEYSQLEDRQKVSALTHDMSVLTEGLLMMQSTLMGIIRVDPKKLLENGIRKELVKQASDILQENTSFKHGDKQGLVSKLEKIGTQMDGIKRSLEYVADYLNCCGLKIFQEEFSRVINFAVEQETNLFSRTKILHFQSVYQSKEIPLPLYHRGDESSTVTYMGRLVNEFVHLTNPKTTLYLPTSSSWFDVKTHTLILGPQVWVLLEKAVDICGLTGIDKLLSFMIQDLFQKVLKGWEIELGEKSTSELLLSTEAELFPKTKIISTPIRTYNGWGSKLIKNLGHMTSFLQIGQLLLLRTRIQYQLKVSASFHAKQLYSNVSLLNSVLAMKLGDNKDLPKDDDPLLIESLSLSEPLGIYAPISKIYVIQRPIQTLPLYLALMSIQLLQKMSYSKSLAILVSRRVVDSLDIYPFATSIVSTLQQFNGEDSTTYFSYLCQYLNSLFVHLSGSIPNPTKECLQDVICVYYFLDLCTQLSPRSREVATIIHSLVPTFDSIPNIITVLNT